jgi:hypothetical protein
MGRRRADQKPDRGARERGAQALGGRVARRGDRRRPPAAAFLRRHSPLRAYRPPRERQRQLRGAFSRNKAPDAPGKNRTCARGLGSCASDSETCCKTQGIGTRAHDARQSMRQSRSLELCVRSRVIRSLAARQEADRGPETVRLSERELASRRGFAALPLASNRLEPTSTMSLGSDFPPFSARAALTCE